MKRSHDHSSRGTSDTLNAFDLDETVTKGSQIARDTGDQVVLNIWAAIEKYEDNPKGLFDELIKDTDTGKLAKIIKCSIAKDHTNALVTFNKNYDYIMFCLAMLGLTQREIEEIFIRHRIAGDNTDSKNGFIEEALDFHYQRLSIDMDEAGPLKVVLLDDKDQNIIAAEAEGYTAIQAQHQLVMKGPKIEVVYPYLDDYQRALGISNVELSGCRLPTIRRRLGLAKQLITPKAVAQARLDAGRAALGSLLRATTSDDHAAASATATAATSIAAQQPQRTNVDLDAAAILAAFSTRGGAYMESRMR